MMAPAPRLQSNAAPGPPGSLPDEPVGDRIREGIDHLRRQGLQLLHVELTAGDLEDLTKPVRATPAVRRVRRYRFQGLEVKPLINVSRSAVVAGYPNRAGRVRYLF